MISRLAGLLVLICAACSATPGAPVASSSAPGATTPTPSPALSTEWTEYHRDAGRTAVGPGVPSLASPKVAWTVSVDGDVYASPLIVAGHVIIATENNTVYSLDLFTGATIWKIHLGQPVDASSLPCGDIGPVTGITGTPAADPAGGLLYVVAFLGARHHMLFGLKLVDGTVASQQDIDPTGSTPAVQQQRGALAIGANYVYVPLGGLYGDCGPYHGYVVAVPRAGGAALSYRVPSARGASIWTAAGVTLDASGNVYAVTGNGASSASFDFSNAVVELSPDLQKVESYFAPANWIALNAGDSDLGALGVTLVSRFALAVGKDGVAYLLNAGQLGGIGGQAAKLGLCAGAFGGTAVVGSTVFVPCTDGLYAVSVEAGGLRVAWVTRHPLLGSPIVAAGAVWAIEPPSATLYALDPATGSVLYSTVLPGAQHFNTPAATEGFVVAPAGRAVV
ncbi:MAG: PQQ-binding-like beta-propeller repeat protein, partial [Candidatus Dormibacteraceae bacterium]